MVTWYVLSNWSYLIGLICADGAVEDVRKSSRTCYFTITSKDKGLITQVKKLLKSSHRIYVTKPNIKQFSNGAYLCSKKYILRVGSKTMCQDLINIGIVPRKSLRLKLPIVPNRFFEFFLRGYFDGDGCVNVSLSDLSIIFTSGCKKYLENLSKSLSDIYNIPAKTVVFNSGAFRLRYRKQIGLKILDLLYHQLNAAPYLERKFKIYYNFVSNKSTAI